MPLYDCMLLLKPHVKTEDGGDNGIGSSCGLQYLNKEDRLLRWPLVKHRHTKYGLEFLNEDDGDLDLIKLPRGCIFNDENPGKGGEH
ncbi:hypothetical protein HRI_002716600 [Hibiscus trionum]|uniref:Uncharacterized protein n=1 Tax=Hibiscus trionum TaxID=183268 RepID=A0A9W7I9M6_HIBTR|nr:hypothetical protein HRI_002716600 [Hibiscus trionum]